MAKHKFIFVREHKIENPATVLETRLSSNGPIVQSIEIPASTTIYKQGKIATFNNKKDADAFARAMGDAVQRQ